MSPFSRLARSALWAALAVCPALTHALPDIGSKPEGIAGFEYVDGRPFSLQALRGNPVVLYFGGDWCGPCRNTRPFIKEIKEKYRDAGLKVIFFSFDDNKERAKKIEEAQALGLDIAMAKPEFCPPGKCPMGPRRGSAAMEGFGAIYKFPTAVVLAPDGTVVDYIDRGNNIRRGLEEIVVKAMAAKP